MTEQEAIAAVVKQFTRLNPTLVNCVNKGAVSEESFKESVYDWMEDKIPAEFRDTAYTNLHNAAWGYDILTPLIFDDGAISDIACHAWNNVWVMTRGKWDTCRFQFRDSEHFDNFFTHVCNMNGVTISERNASDNCTDITTCPDFRMRLNFVHKSINTDGTNVFSIRKIPTHKKTLEMLTAPEEGMLTMEAVEKVKKHLSECTSFIVVGMGGSGKTTFLNAAIEVLPEDWKFLFIQENEELFSYTHKNADFLHTVKGINEYDVSHDLQELARNGLLMSTKCFIIGEIKGAEALYLLNATNTGAVGAATLHSDSAEHGLHKLADYIMYASKYTKDQVMSMLTVINKVFFLKDYRLKEICTIKDYDSTTQKLICETEYY